ncbi:hypothetical protein ACFYXD_35565 [Streptomyces platensis]|uniref:hypothetical protein n=1 Tax=Streptomyces platensis TaxID=58346 RepID=UPI0036CBC7E3
MCEYCGVLEGEDAQRCPGWLEHRATQVYRVEGWEYDAWTMMSGAKDTIAEAELRMGQLKARFPETPMRIVAETTSYMVVRTAPGQAPPSDGDQMT